MKLFGGRKTQKKCPAKRHPFRRAGGFTLIEVLIDFMVVALVATAVITAFSAAYGALGLAKAKIAAVALANEKMETIRNMTYDDLATEYGPIYPPGNLPDDETISRKNADYTVHTVISYVDDPFDGNAEGTVGGKPVDLYPYDYKRVEITVYKVGRPIHLAKLTSDVSAKAAETPSETGIIKLCIIDATGAPVPQVDVTIENTEVSPAVNIVATTGDDGCIMIPSLPEDHQNQYHLTAEKDGYSFDMTYPRTAQNPNATHPDVDVLIQNITYQTLVIDELSAMNITVKDELGSVVPNTNVHMWGAKEIYFNPSTYKYDQNHTTDVNGVITLSDMEFDDYYFEVAGYTIVSTSPYQPTKLDPDTTLDVTIIVSTNPNVVTIRKIEPTWGYEGDTIYMTIWGQNFLDGVQVYMKKGATQIDGYNIVVDHVGDEEIIEVDFDIPLSSAEVYDLYIANPSENPVVQENAFEIFVPGS